MSTPCSPRGYNASQKEGMGQEARRSREGCVQERETQAQHGMDTAAALSQPRVGDTARRDRGEVGDGGETRAMSPAGGSWHLVSKAKDGSCEPAVEGREGARPPTSAPSRNSSPCVHSPVAHAPPGIYLAEVRSPSQEPPLSVPHNSPTPHHGWQEGISAPEALGSCLLWSSLPSGKAEREACSSTAPFAGALGSDPQNTQEAGSGESEGKGLARGCKTRQWQGWEFASRAPTLCSDPASGQRCIQERPLSPAEGHLCSRPPTQDTVLLSPKGMEPAPHKGTFLAALVSESSQPCIWKGPLADAPSLGSSRVQPQAAWKHVSHKVAAFCLVGSATAAREAPVELKQRHFHRVSHAFASRAALHFAAGLRGPVFPKISLYGCNGTISLALSGQLCCHRKAGHVLGLSSPLFQ